MSEQSDPMRTALYELHREAGAKLIEFGGWMMPVQYSGIIAEHRKVREAAGAFDLSHMGRLYISGHDALAFLQLLVTNDVSKLAPMQVQYSPVCNRSGGVRDDILISRLGENEYLLVVNASNREKILGWIDEVAKGVGGGSMGFSLEDRTLDTVMIGVQGPLSERFLQPLTEVSLSDLRYYYLSAGPVLGVQGLVSRTGYTGEDGFEVILPAESGVRLWRELAQVASTGSMVLAGLGARDTLRLEAGMPLYGHELDETINPLEVRLGRFVRMEKGEFMGREALLQISQAGPRRRLVGLEIPDRAISRQGTAVLAGGAQVGQVTSGTFSPILDRSIAMALLETDKSSGETPLEVVVRGTTHSAGIVSLPFYRRPRF